MPNEAIISFYNKDYSIFSAENIEYQPRLIFRRKLDQTIFHSIIKHLDQEKIFLDPHISLIKLSMKVGTNTTYLSHVINSYFHCNFRELINLYRVNYCLKLLATNEKISIKELPAQCGFSSLSAFYMVFKKKMGIPPKDYYRKLHYGDMESIG